MEPTALTGEVKKRPQKKGEIPVMRHKMVKKKNIFFMIFSGSTQTWSILWFLWY